MNKARRQELNKLNQKLQLVTTNEELKECINELESIKSDEEEYYDNMPENLQGSMRGSDSEEAISNMDEALDQLNEALDADGDNRKDFIDDAISLIEDAQF